MQQAAGEAEHRTPKYGKDQARGFAPLQAVLHAQQQAETHTRDRSEGQRKADGVQGAEHDCVRRRAGEGPQWSAAAAEQVVGQVQATEKVKRDPSEAQPGQQVAADHGLTVLRGAGGAPPGGAP